jgi:hypothetical protein
VYDITTRVSFRSLRDERVDDDVLGLGVHEHFPEDIQAGECVDWGVAGYVAGLEPLEVVFEDLRVLVAKLNGLLLAGARPLWF